MRIAEKLDPLSPIIVTDLGWAYFLAGQTDQAIAQYRKALDLEPAFVTAVDRLTQAYLKKGAYKEALDMMDFNPEFPDDIAAVMQTAYRRSGYPGALQAELAMALKRKARGEASDPYSFAFLYASLGQNDRALENLQEAYDERYPGLIYMNVDPPFEAMRGNPRFQAMERRVGLIP
jgi:serine/threonine-protein kinase